MRTTINPKYLPPLTLAAAYPGSPLYVGSRGENVRQIQECLNNVSRRFPMIPYLAEDGVFGNATKNAVLIFQSMFGLSRDAVVGPATWNKLTQECSSLGEGNNGEGGGGYPGYILGVGSSGDAVLRVQKNLNKISALYPAYSLPKIAEDGIFGNGTRNAVITFQRQAGLNPDGLVGTLTWNKLAEAASSAGSGGTPGGNPGGEPGGTPGANQLNPDEQEVFNLINQQRANNGLSPLKSDGELQKVARTKAQDMAANSYFSHDSPVYGSPFDMMNTFGIKYRTAGENIAGNSRNSAAVTAWMNSSGHRANILNRNFDSTGIGVVPDPRYGKVYVQMFIQK
ncbi:MAG: peptidoglycan-binding protein [Clostridiales bacterium]|nr:peptidoglycan-binding protein [Clostridiales bacterium]